METAPNVDKMQTSPAPNVDKIQASPASMEKDIVKSERTMTDDIMTIIFLLQIALVFYNVRNDRYWLAILVVAIVGVSLIIASSKKLAQIFGNFISNKLLNTSWTPIKCRRPLKKIVTMKKFKDQAWQACAFCVS